MLYEISIVIILMLAIMSFQIVYSAVGFVGFLLFFSLLALMMSVFSFVRQRLGISWEVAFLSCFVWTPAITAVALILLHL